MLTSSCVIEDDSVPNRSRVDGSERRSSDVCVTRDRRQPLLNVFLLPSLFLRFGEERRLRAWLRLSRIRPSLGR
jgi:hypothetical protein